MKYIVAAYTDTGIQKTTNQDSLCIRRAAVGEDRELVMAVICDGMGGLEKGELASAVCINAFGDWFDRNMWQLPELCAKSFDAVKDQWTRLIRSVHGDLLAYSALTGVQLGTTVSGFLTNDDRYLTVNVGDSRVYERKNALKQLTQDQSLVAREVASGRITEDEARHHPQRNILLQCLGAGESVTPEFTEGRVQNEALYLMCTDGLAHELSKSEMEAELQPAFLQSKEAMTEALRRVTEECKRRGETDNITSILVAAHESAGPAPAKGGLRRLFHRDQAPQEAVRASLVEKAQITFTHETLRP